MAVESIPKSVSVSIKLNNGTDTSGNIKTVGISLGSLSMSGYDAEKVLDIVDVLKPCLSKSVYSTEETKVSRLMRGE